MPGLTMSLRWMVPEHLVVLRDDQRRPTAAGDLLDVGATRSGRAAEPPSEHQRATESAAPLRIDSPLLSTPLMRVVAEKGTNSHPSADAGDAPRRAASATMLRPSGVSSARRSEVGAPARAAASSMPPAGRNSAACLLPRVIVPVLSSSSVSTSPAASTARPRHREHVLLHQPVDAGDADGRQQRADRRRYQADEQRDQNGDADRACPRTLRTAAARRPRT